MKNNNLSKFLEFDGKKIEILSADGTWWVAVKPICEALNINYDRTYKNILADEILAQLYAKQHIVAADNRLREMVCLPEKYIYGWLFSLRSESPELKKYKLQCYNVLYDHFHNPLHRRFGILQEKMDYETQLDELENELMQDDKFRRYKDLQAKKKQCNNSLKKEDFDLLRGQMTIVFS